LLQKAWVLNSYRVKGGLATDNLDEIRKLEASFGWEVRSIVIFVPLGTLVEFIFGPVAGYYFGGIGIAVVLGFQSMFFVKATSCFLRPIEEMLDLGQKEEAGDEADGWRMRMQRTKLMVIAGTCLAVGSSGLLYINLAFYFAWHDYVSTQIFLNPFVFGTNFDSVLNDIAMVLACGVLVRKLPTSERLGLGGLARSKLGVPLMSDDDDFGGGSSSGTIYWDSASNLTSDLGNSKGHLHKEADMVGIFEKSMDGLLTHATEAQVSGARDYPEPEGTDSGHNSSPGGCEIDLLGSPASPTGSFLRAPNHVHSWTGSTKILGSLGALSEFYDSSGSGKSVAKEKDTEMSEIEVEMKK
jgi:hypothetical protein